MDTLRSIDLNLLVILNALLEEGHVTRASERLGLSQPATSAALSRCRDLFVDPLLERADGAMRLTPKAARLQAPLKRFLGDAVTLLDPASPKIEDIRQQVRVVTADHMAAIIAGALLPRLAQSAPGIDLVFQPWNAIPAALDAMAKGSIDLAVSIFGDVPPNYHREELLRERWVVLMRKGHPAAENFDLDQWLDYPHILMSGRGDARGVLDETLSAIGRRRRIGLVVPSFLMIPSLVAQSDLVSMLPSRCLPPDAASNFHVVSPPIEIEDFSLHMAWHDRRASDPAVAHIRTVLKLAEL